MAATAGGRLRHGLLLEPPASRAVAAGEDATVLSPADHAFFAANGYVCIQNAVPDDLIDAVTAEMFGFLGMDPRNPEGWYTPVEKEGAAVYGGSMVELYQTQALSDVRQHPKVHQAFSELWGDEKLWCSFDRVHLKPPATMDGWGGEGGLHWDLSQEMLRGAAQHSESAGADLQKNLLRQGVLYLADTSATGGNFKCVPKFHDEFAEWARSQPSDEPLTPASLADRAVQIAARKGTLLVWHNFLPHGNGKNTDATPRLAQYMAMARGQAARLCNVPAARRPRGGARAPPAAVHRAHLGGLLGGDAADGPKVRASHPERAREAHAAGREALGSAELVTARR
jgi:hypothetical protein